MPRFRLTLPDELDPFVAAESSDEPSTPSAQLELSLAERLQDWFDERFRPEYAATVKAHRESWCKGVAEEVRFWDHYLRTKGYLWPDDYAWRTDPELPLQVDLAELIVEPEGSTVRILDVGAGPLTFVGRSSPRWTVELTAVDPLAGLYTQLLDLHGLVPPVRTAELAAEAIRSRFARNSFELVVARNSLDHALDPVSAIEQMVAVVRPGRCIFLSHHINEAINNDWLGLHQWNFSDEAGNLILSSKNSRIDITEKLRPVATVSNHVWIERDWLLTTIRKKA